MAISRFSFPTMIYFGPGVRSQVKDHLVNAGFKRPLIITDKGLATLPMFKTLEKDFAAGGKLNCATFSGIWGNPTKSQVTEGVKAFKAHETDCIIGVGGGAALDIAKAIALMATHSGDLFDYEDEKPGAKPIDGPIPYWIAMPTTSGTGSEVGRSAVVSDDVTHVKKIIFSPKLLAKAVFADPELTLELPASITASTGMDALTHNVEAYLAKGFHPIADGIALEGIRLAAKSLVKAVKNPSDIEARSNMMMSSMMGAIAFQKGLGVVHSCAHSLSAVHDQHHGYANAVMIDHALKHNLTTVPERFVTMNTVVGINSTEPSDFLKWLSKLKADVGIPARLSGTNAKKESIQKLADFAIQDGCHGSNPRVCTREDFVRIFTEAF